MLRTSRTPGTVSLAVNPSVRVHSQIKQQHSEHVPQRVIERDGERHCLAHPNILENLTGYSAVLRALVHVKLS